MTAKKVLVTGANGFIGAYLTKKLISLGKDTSVFVRKNSDKWRLNPILGQLEVFEVDITDDDHVIKLIQQIKPEIIFHLAGSGVHSYFDTSTNAYNEMIQSNIQGTVNLLMGAEKSACSLFINTGSCYEYGSSRKSFTEESLLQPKNVYGSTKAATTLIAHAFCENNHIAVSTVRPFTVYGPQEDKRRFISNIVRKCLQGEKPQIPKNTIVRDYIFIDDVVEGYIRLAELEKQPAGEIINISTGVGTSLLDAVNLIIRLTEADVSVDIGGFPALPGEVEFLIGDPKKAEHLLSWKATYALEEGLIKTIAWIRNSS
jgi:nucleoside-diphosphate-sugar epimerase